VSPQPEAAPLIRLSQPQPPRAARHADESRADCSSETTPTRGAAPTMATAQMPLRQRLNWEATKAVKAGLLDAGALDTVRRLVREPATPETDAKVAKFADAFFARLARVAPACSPPARAPAPAAAAASTAGSTAEAPLVRLPEALLRKVARFLVAQDFASWAQTSTKLFTSLLPPGEWGDVLRAELGDALDAQLAALVHDDSLFPRTVTASDRQQSIAQGARGMQLLVNQDSAPSLLRARWLLGHLHELGLSMVLELPMRGGGAAAGATLRQPLVLHLEGEEEPRVVDAMRGAPDPSAATRPALRVYGRENRVVGAAAGAERARLVRVGGEEVEVEDVEEEDDEEDEEEDESDDDDLGQQHVQGANGARAAPQRAPQPRYFLRLIFSTRSVGVLVGPRASLVLSARANMTPAVTRVTPAGVVEPDLRGMQPGGRIALRTRPEGRACGETWLTTVGRTGCMALGRAMYGDENHFRHESFVSAEGGHGQSTWSTTGWQERVSHVAARFRAPGGFYEVDAAKRVVVLVPVDALFAHCAPAP